MVKKHHNIILVVSVFTLLSFMTANHLVVMYMLPVSFEFFLEYSINFFVFVIPSATHTTTQTAKKLVASNFYWIIILDLISCQKAVDLCTLKMIVSNRFWIKL